MRHDLRLMSIDCKAGGLKGILPRLQVRGSKRCGDSCALNSDELRGTLVGFEPAGGVTFHRNCGSG